MRRESQHNKQNGTGISKLGDQNKQNTKQKVPLCGGNAETKAKWGRGFSAPVKMTCPSKQRNQKRTVELSKAWRTREGENEIEQSTFPAPPPHAPPACEELKKTTPNPNDAPQNVCSALSLIWQNVDLYTTFNNCNKLYRPSFQKRLFA